MSIERYDGIDAALAAIDLREKRDDPFRLCCDQCRRGDCSLCLIRRPRAHCRYDWKCLCACRELQFPGGTP